MYKPNIKLSDYNQENFALLGKRDWVKDYGFNKAIELAQCPDGSLRNYFVYEKSHKSLWDLGFGVMPERSELAAWRYLDLPPDSTQFIEWVYNNVTDEFFINGERPNMDDMPYLKLYKLWRYYTYTDERKEGEKALKI